MYRYDFPQPEVKELGNGMACALNDGDGDGDANGQSASSQQPVLSYRLRHL